MNKVALRYQAIYLDVKDIDMSREPSAPALAFLARLRERGYTVTEELLHALYAVPSSTLADITKDIDEALGVNLNWMPLVKGWDTPTGESFADHLVTWFVNLIGAEVPGTELPCGHLIPDGTFPLERYNGCPFCGRPFRTANYVYKGQGSKLKELRLMRKADMQHLFETLLTSSTPLDATQLDSLRLLIQNSKLEPQDLKTSKPYNLIVMRETRMVVVDALVEQERDEEAQSLFETPTDILRFLWFKKTQQLQLIEPRTLIAHARRLNRHLWAVVDQSQAAGETMRENLKLKYNRSWCRRVAGWLNNLPMEPRVSAENMNSKRGMWVRMIHALRLGEYSRKQGYERLRELLNVFYKQDYTTWQGQLDAAFAHNEGQTGVGMLVQRPGLFARSLYAAILHFGDETVLNAFRTVVNKVPARLLLSLANGAEAYFDPDGIGGERVVRPITGTPKNIPLNKLLSLYSLEDRRKMSDSIAKLFLQSIEQHYIKSLISNPLIPNPVFVYIAPALYDIPVPVGDRSTTIQDTSCALQGTRFAVVGDAVRLFLQWGKGLPAQPLDMDLSARMVMKNGEVVECAYFNLAPTLGKNEKGEDIFLGAKHSGDIRSIPDQVGTAEYIELELPLLERTGVRYVVFTCNAYSNGALSPNLMVGWMSSENPMTISEQDGVAYDPSCVQHIVRVGEANLSKGLVFGVLKVAEREIVWMEIPFTAQIISQLNGGLVENMLRRLENKVSIGQLLELKAKAQKQMLVNNPEDANEQYTYEWALNSAEVANTLLN